MEPPLLRGIDTIFGECPSVVEPGEGYAWLVVCLHKLYYGVFKTNCYETQPTPVPLDTKAMSDDNTADVLVISNSPEATKKFWSALVSGVSRTTFYNVHTCFNIGPISQTSAQDKGLADAWRFVADHKKVEATMPVTSAGGDVEGIVSIYCELAMPEEHGEAKMVKLHFGSDTLLREAVDRNSGVKPLAQAIVAEIKKHDADMGKLAGVIIVLDGDRRKRTDDIVDAIGALPRELGALKIGLAFCDVEAFVSSIEFPTKNGVKNDQGLLTGKVEFAEYVLPYLINGFPFLADRLSAMEKSQAAQLNYSPIVPEGFDVLGMIPQGRPADAAQPYGSLQCIADMVFADEILARAQTG